MWDVDDNEFQVATIEALMSLDFLKEISIYTSYKVTSTDFLEVLTSNRNDLEIKVYKKDWTDRKSVV